MADNTSFRDDRGTVLVHLAFALLTLIAFGTFAFDYGVFWVSRNQAQNAADSGALAGALALALDDRFDVSVTGPAKAAAVGAAQANMVWGQAPNITPATDIQIFTGVTCPTPNVRGSCIRVDVFRNQAKGNPLPMFFGSLVGLTQQGVQASATAMALPANASTCFKPWALTDRWAENNPVVAGPWLPTSQFDTSGPNPDVYVAQNGLTSGTTFSIAFHGQAMTLKHGNAGDPISPGWFQPLDLGSMSYRDNISGCADVLWGIDDVIPKDTGALLAQTLLGVGDLIALDPYATWNATTLKIENSCVGASYTCSVAGYTQSPRLVTIPVFDLAYYLATGGSGSGTVRVTNMLGFFVENIVGNDISGVVVTTPALAVSNKGGVAPGASLAITPALVR